MSAESMVSLGEEHYHLKKREELLQAVLIFVSVFGTSMYANMYQHTSEIILEGSMGRPESESTGCPGSWYMFLYDSTSNSHVALGRVVLYTNLPCAGNNATLDSAVLKQ